MHTILEKYQHLGERNSFLGEPIEDEHINPDGIGRCRHFEDGAIYWHPETGAYEVHGAINAKWTELGGLSSFLGYPTSDELIAGDGRGRCSCFQKGRIYWTPEAGTWSTDLYSDKATVDWVSFNAQPLPDHWLAKHRAAALPQKLDYSDAINFTRNQEKKSGAGYGCMTYALLHIVDILKDWEHPYSPAVSWHYAEWQSVNYRLKHNDLTLCLAWVAENGLASEGTCPTNWDTEHQLRGTFPDGWPIPRWNEPGQLAKDEASLCRVKIRSEKNWHNVESGNPSPSIEVIKQFLRFYGPIWCCGAGHAKAIVGYDDTTQQFKILDSYVHSETGGRNITYIPYNQVQPNGEISAFSEVVNIPSEQRATGRYAYSARIRIENNWRGTYTVSVGVEGKQPLVVWTTRGRNSNIGNYTRYDWQQDQVDEGYPLSITAWHLPSHYASGIDAALNGQGQYAGKAYFFKGNQYVRYDWQQDRVDEGYPLSLAAWHLPSHYASGIDAALNGQGQYAGKAYFFKGNQYVRYDWQQDRVDEGYPLPLTAWHLPPGGFVGAPATISRDSSVCNVYVRGTDNRLWQRAYYDGQWHGWQRHSGLDLASMPAVGSMASDHEHVFVRGTDGQMWEKWWTVNDGWSSWTSLGAPPGGFVDAPAIVSRDPSVCNVYVRGTDNHLWQRAYYDGQWHNWACHNDGSVLASMPAVGSMASDHEHVFVRGTDGQVWEKWWTASGGWSGWTSLGAPPGGFVDAPAIVSRDPSVCNVYVRGSDNHLWQRAYYDGQWHNWACHNDGSVLASMPAVGSMASDHEHVFVRDTDGQMWEKWWTAGGGWSGWTSLGAPPDFASRIDAALNGQGKYAGKAYFFSKDYYVRYDWQKDQIDEGYPRLMTEWHLSQIFNWGIDAALNGQGKYAGKAYFFRRDDVPLETSRILAIDVPLPDYAASCWPPSSSHRWFLRVEDHDRDSATGIITEFTLARRYINSSSNSIGKYRTETFGGLVSVTVPDPTTGSIVPSDPYNPPIIANPNPGVAMVYVPSAGGSMRSEAMSTKYYSIDLAGDAIHSPIDKIILSGQLITTSSTAAPIANQKVELFELDLYAINRASSCWVACASTHTNDNGKFKFEVAPQQSLGAQVYAVAISDDQGEILSSSECILIEQQREGDPMSKPVTTIQKKTLSEIWAKVETLLN